ncbi:MAG: hypothetical protein LIQ31_05910 [Planctomycetes bacterium]|nr:hypothetical protein [Planctomycetota bacterium]
MPKEIASLAASILRDPVKVAVAPVSSAVETVTQSVYHVQKSNKGRLLVDLLQKSGGDASLVFSRTKHGADKICKMLNTAGIKAGAIHGNKTQNARRDALDGFKRGRLRVLVATDIAARGIDIEALPLVVNYDLPDVPETYVHRIGRTGRAGRVGSAVSFCDAEERSSLRDIERLISRSIPIIQDHPFAASVGEPIRAEPRRQSAATPNRNSGQRRTGSGRPGSYRSAESDSRPARRRAGRPGKRSDSRSDSRSDNRSDNRSTERGQKRRRARAPYRKTA